MIDEGYFEYLEELYRDIYGRIKKKDIGVDQQKLHMFFEKSAEPYFYWMQEHKEQPKVENPAALLEAIKKKFKLEVTKDGFKLPGYLGRDDFKVLAEKMRIAGYEYSKDAGEFMKVVRQ